MKVLDLFSGIGGFSLGLERAGMQTVAFCEIDPYCRKVLAKHWPGVKSHDDVKQLDGSQYVGAVDVICGGYPCQPFSAAGKQQGEKDPRHLWPEMHRIIREARPRWVVAENVRGHVSLGFDTVAAQLEDDGFTVWPFIVPACAVGAPHRRDRLWIVAYHPGNGRGTRRKGRSDSSGKREPEQPLQLMGDPAGTGLLPSTLAGVHCQAEGEGARHEESQRRGSALAHADGERQLQPQGCLEGIGRRAGDGGEAMADTNSQPQIGPAIPREERNPWTIEPDVGRVANGIPDRVDRIKALGNAVVPQIPELIGRTIMAYEQQ